MAEALGLAASVIAVVDISLKVVSKCKNIIETAKEAPRELRTILVETSSLTSALENLKFLSDVDQDYSESIANQQGICDAVGGCKATLEELSDELGSLSVPGAGSDGSRRRKAVTAVSWTWKATSVKRLLEDLGRYKSTISIGLLSQTARDVSELKTAVQEVAIKLSDAEQRKICDWLELANPTGYHNQASGLQEKRTCQWILRMDAWNSWLDVEQLFPSRSIWIYGMPGAGKTCLASFLVRECQKYCRTQPASEAICIYYYCFYQNTHKEPESLLCWLVSQLCRKLDHMSFDIRSFYLDNARPTTEDLLRILGDLLKAVGTVYLIVDAVDESSGRDGSRDEMLSLLESFITDPEYQQIRLLATSRRYPDIEHTLSRCSATISMNNSEVGKDIHTYVAAELGKARFAHHSEDLRGEILKAVAKGAKGMFRWAFCQLDILRRKRTRHDVLQALKELPETLDATYERVLLSIPRDDRALARTILTWICASDKLGRPLSVAVLVQKLNRDVRDQNHTYGPEIIDQVCGCLVRTPKQRDFKGRRTYRIAKLAHYTVREFLSLDRIGLTEVGFFAVTEDSIVDLFGISVAQIAAEFGTLERGDGSNDHNNLVYYSAKAVMAGARGWKQSLTISRLWETIWVCLNKEYPISAGVKAGTFFDKLRGLSILPYMSDAFFPGLYPLLAPLYLSPLNEDSVLARKMHILCEILYLCWLEAADMVVKNHHLPSLLRAKVRYDLAVGNEARPFSGTVFECFLLDLSGRTMRSAIDMIKRHASSGRHYRQLLRDLMMEARLHEHIGGIIGLGEAIIMHEQIYSQLDCCGSGITCWFLEIWADAQRIRHAENTGVDFIKTACYMNNCNGLAWLLKAGANPNGPNYADLVEVDPKDVALPMGIWKYSPLFALMRRPETVEGKLVSFFDASLISDRVRRVRDAKMLLIQHGGREILYAPRDPEVARQAHLEAKEELEQDRQRVGVDSSEGASFADSGDQSREKGSDASSSEGSDDDEA